MAKRREAKPAQWNEFQWTMRRFIRSPLGGVVFGKPVGGANRPRSQEPNPEHPEPLRDFQLFATVKSWNEEDVIAATVKNARTQGVDKVFLIDNGSDDGTVERATAAGAVVAEHVRTEFFDDEFLLALVNSVVAKESMRSGSDHVWWLHLDCDEFPEGPDGLTVRRYLEGLDRRFRVVGSAVLNHLPTERPAYVTGYHPLEFQPVCYEITAGEHGCTARHYKHPLQRFDRAGTFVKSGVGAHYAQGEDPALKIEPASGIVLHHFQYREEARTRAALQRLAGPGAARSKHMDEGRTVNNAAERLRSLADVYAGRWDRVTLPPGDDTVASMQPRPWPHEPRRWYDTSELGGRAG